MIWIDLAFGPRYMGLNLRKNESGLQFNLFIYLVIGPRFGPRLGLNLAWLNGACRAQGASLGGPKKTCLLNGLGPDNRYGPMRKVQV